MSEDGQKVKRTKVTIRQRLCPPPPAALHSHVLIACLFALAQPLGPIEEAIKAQDECSLFAAPFPFSATLEQLTAFFSKVAPVKCVRMRRHLNSRDFRGSVFVEFDTLESANKVKDMVLEYEGATIRLQPKTEFKEQVIEERHSKAASRPQKQVCQRLDQPVSHASLCLHAPFVCFIPSHAIIHFLDILTLFPFLAFRFLVPQVVPCPDPPILYPFLVSNRPACKASLTPTCFSFVGLHNGNI